MSGKQIDCEELTVRGRVALEGRTVTAAELLAADPPGLLVLTPTTGMIIEVEQGAVIRGIALMGYTDTDTGDAVDETSTMGNTLALLFVRCTSATGFTAKDQDGSMVAEHRLSVHSRTGGADADGIVRNSPTFIVYTMDGGWSVGNTAP